MQTIWRGHRGLFPHVHIIYTCKCKLIVFQLETGFKPTVNFWEKVSDFWLLPLIGLCGCERAVSWKLSGEIGGRAFADSFSNFKKFAFSAIHLQDVEKWTKKKRVKIIWRQVRTLVFPVQTYKLLLFFVVDDLRTIQLFRRSLNSENDKICITGSKK